MTTIPTSRWHRSHAHLGMLIGLLVSISAVGPAVAAGHHPAGPAARTAPRITTAAVTGQAQSGTLSQMTGLSASQIKSAPVCPPVRPGQARCESLALVVRSNEQLVRPLIKPRASFTQIFPHAAQGIVPAAAATAATAPQAGTPPYLQQAYDLSYLSQTAGSADTVAIVDAYDSPNAEADLGTYRSTYGLAPCTTGNGCLRKVNEHGASSPLPGADPVWEMEIALDLDAVSALCPNCRILLVESSSISADDMQLAMATAAAMGANQISASWAVLSIAPVPGTYTFPGVAVVAATGDSGYVGPTGDDAYPAALPGVTAAGGTTLTGSTTATPSARGWTESAWSASSGSGGGSGCDLHEPKPAYQMDTGCTGRSYADVSADANPSTGLVVYNSDHGGWLLAGGTSLAAPLIAAYDAVTAINASSPQWAYINAAVLNDPSTGSAGNCAAAISYICNAGPGYDGPTGAGSISGDVVDGAPGIGGPGVGSGTTGTYTQSVFSGGATLTGGVYANGVATSYRWQYGTTTDYGQQTPAVGIGSDHAPVAVTGSLSGLSADTTYHYRLVAVNSVGTSYGYDYSLTIGPGASPPLNSGAPVVTGTARQGQALTTTSGSWNPMGSTYSYLWQSSTAGASTWTNITAATGTTYTPTVADIGSSLRVAVTAKSPSGTASATSNALGPVLSGAPAATSPPVITGPARQGQTLTTTSGRWNPAGTTYTYLWQRLTRRGGSWTNIIAATKTTYTPTDGDVGASLRAAVTATNRYGRARHSSNVLGPATAVAVAKTARPSISDSPPSASPSSASAVLVIGDRVLRNSRGAALGIASVTALASTVNRSRRTKGNMLTPRSTRVVVVRRARGVHGRLRTWVCSIERRPAGTVGGDPRRCTAHVWFRSIVTFGLPASTRGELRIVLVRSGATTR